jgi:putative glutamine amidotransferase
MKHFIKHFTALLLIGILVFQSCDCGEQSNDQGLRIAISKEGKSKNYSGWLKRYDENITWFNLYPLGIDSALRLLETCNGLLLTGGEDVFPGIYGKINDTADCGTINRYRDSLEFALITAALDARMPMIGICRGEQILNVSFGGTLHIDIPTDFDTIVIHRQKDWRNCFHSVELLPNTRLFALSGVESGEVTSNHHQGIEILGQGLRISALANDGLPEAIEWNNPDGKGFLMAVQWHPERMDTLHPLSAPIAKKFLLEASKFYEKQ